MNDILSDYCELPTGVWGLEFVPVHEIDSWESGVPLPAVRWYGIGVYRNSLSYTQPTEDTDQGPLTRVAVSCLVVNDSQAAADQLDNMERMQFALRVTHFDGKKRVVGRPGEYCRLLKTDYSPAEIVGAQGYSLTFEGEFSKRPLVV